MNARRLQTDSDHDSATEVADVGAFGFAQNYVVNRHSAVAKWKSFDLSAYPHHCDQQIPDAMVPFFGADIFGTFTAEEKVLLNETFMQFAAENNVLFEQVLLKAERRLRAQFPDAARKEALRSFAREEFYHLRAYRRYLDTHRPGVWPKPMVSREAPTLKRVLAWLVHIEPTCIFVPGAKVEVFSLHYTKLLKNSYAPQVTDWVQLNLMHSADEVHHFGFDLDLFASCVKDRNFIGKLRAYFFVTVMIVAIQAIVATAGWRILKHSFPNRSLAQRIKLNLRFFHWMLRVFPPYRDTLAQMKKLYAKNPYPKSFFFRFTTW